MYAPSSRGRVILGQPPWSKYEVIGGHEVCQPLLDEVPGKPNWKWFESTRPLWFTLFILDRAVFLLHRK